MSITIIHENEYSKAYFDTELKAGIIDWKNKKLTEEEYRRPLEALIEYSNGKKIFENYLIYTIQICFRILKTNFIVNITPKYFIRSLKNF